MSKVKFIILLIFILCFTCFFVNAAEDISLYVDGKKVSSDVAPVAVSGRTMVPARSIFEKLGAEVTWFGSRQQIIIRSVKARIVLNLGSDIAYVNNKSVKLDVEPMVINGRTLIPVRFVSEELGYNVKWNPNDNSVHINTKEDKIIPDVEKISVTKKGNATVVTAKVSNMVRPSISYASDPTRFIADFPNAELSIDGSSYKVESKSVKEIRYAIHPEYTRIVIESPVDVTYKVSYTSNTMVVTVTSIAKDDDKENNKEDNKEDDAKEEIGDIPIVSSKDTLVVIDAGHGGDDCGAIGYDSDGNEEIYESEANLAIALKAEKYLKEAGVSVIMTRTKDVSLGSSEMEDLLARSKIANDSGATLFVSIHNNSFTSETASGTEILYADTENKIYDGITSKELAENIIEPLVKATGLSDRGIKDSPMMVVLRTTTMPSVLIETAFVSNPEDRKVLLDQDSIDDIGYAIAQGIVKSLKER